MRIYTRRGDDGSTSLYGGPRVSKAAHRVAAYGSVDELNSVLGWARAAPLSAPTDTVLAAVQDTCFRAGAHLASVPGKDPGVPGVADADVVYLEAEVDRCEDALPPLTTFILPGGSEAGARLHVARTVCRRAERDLVTLMQDEPVDPTILRWLNRLSDLLFTLARWENRETPERPWTGRKA
jgi:cob(I)alamin adenosyltransferase